MAAATYVFTKQKQAQVQAGPINFATNTLVCLLVVAGSGIPSVVGGAGGCAFVADVLATNAEVTGTGYARQTLTGVTVAVDGTTNTQIDFSHAAITFAQNAAGFTTGRYLVFYTSSIGVADASYPVFMVFDPNVTLSAVTGSVVFSSPTGGELQWV